VRWAGKGRDEDADNLVTDELVDDRLMSNKDIGRAA
jgi:hypothetical protein